MKKWVLVLVLLLVSSCAYAGERVSLSGYLKNEIALREEGLNSDLQKFKSIVELSGEYKIKEDELVFFAKTKYWYDAAYDWRDKYDAGQDQMGHIQRTQWLRDCYLDYNKGPWFLRLGKQQVAWGQADGITILDRVNPVDLTEYWLPDMVDIRIPLWMANINYSPKLNSNLQLLIIPDFEQSEAAPDAAPFAFRSVKLFERYKQRKRDIVHSVTNTDISYPSKQFDNSTFALQWQDRIGDLEYTLNYLDGFYYSAKTYLTGGVSPSTAPGDVWYLRRFTRWKMYGSSMNKTFTNPGPMQGVTLRGDFAYYDDEPIYYGNVNTGTTLGVKRWDNIFWLMGLDRCLLTKWSVSFQYAQYIMQHKNAGTNPPNNFVMNAYTYGPQDRLENIFTLKISSHFLNDRILPELLWSTTDDRQGRLAPKINFELTDNLWLTLGGNYFYGDEFDTNGQFRDQSQIYTNIKYTF